MGHSGTVTSSRVVALAGVLADIRTRPARGGVRLVGIDGPSASGKSTLARRIRELAPGTALVKGDDFVSWADLQTWWPRFEAQVLAPLRAGRDARYQVRDWIGDEFGSALKRWKTARASPLVIVEGVSMTRAAAGVDFAIWVEAPQHTRLERGLARDGTDHAGVWANWLEMEHAFFAHDGTKQRADLRLDGAAEVEHDPATQAVLLE